MYFKKSMFVFALAMSIIALTSCSNSISTKFVDKNIEQISTNLTKLDLTANKAGLYSKDVLGLQISYADLYEIIASAVPNYPKIDKETLLSNLVSIESELTKTETFILSFGSIEWELEVDENLNVVREEYQTRKQSYFQTTQQIGAIMASLSAYEQTGKVFLETPENENINLYIPEVKLADDMTVTDLYLESREFGFGIVSAKINGKLFLPDREDYGNREKYRWISVSVKDSYYEFQTLLSIQKLLVNKEVTEVFIELQSIHPIRTQASLSWYGKIIKSAVVPFEVGVDSDNVFKASTREDYTFKDRYELYQYLGINFNEYEL